MKNILNLLKGGENIEIFLDIDGILCPDLHKNFRSASYRYDYVDFINSLYKKGHKITLWTSRGIQENDATALDDTKKILEGVGLKYHNIIKKPFFDILVDDKALNSIDTLKKMFEKFGGHDAKKNKGLMEKALDF